eukprot:2059527-Prymnesium_polylepis.1
MPQEPLPAGVTLPKRPTGIYLPEFQKVIKSHDGQMQRHHKGLGPAPNTCILDEMAVQPPLRGRLNDYRRG